MMIPRVINTQSINFSTVVRFGPNILRCAAAGKITETDIVQIRPTKEHKKLKDGKNTATQRAKIVNKSLIVDEAASTIRSLVRYGAIVSSSPNASGNIVSVTFEKAVGRHRIGVGNVSLGKKL
jgi:hypothetical protein